MRAVDPALAARLAQGATTLCACWRIDRRDGVALGFTDHDAAISFDGVTFAADAALAGGALEQATGLAADSVEVSGALRSDAVTAADVARGAYDGARVRRWLVDWREPALRLLMFAGEIGEITREGAAFRAEVLGAAAALNRPLGRAYLAGCDAVLGDARCGVDLDAPAHRAAAVVLGVEADGAMRVAGLERHAPGWFAQGQAAWTAGANAGARDVIGADVSRDGARLVALWGRPAAAVAAGDRLTLSAGCDKRAATCREKFANMMNFRGFPHMPGDDWVTSHPAPGGVHDGGSRHG